MWTSHSPLRYTSRQIIYNIYPYPPLLIQTNHAQILRLLCVGAEIRASEDANLSSSSLSSPRSRVGGGGGGNLNDRELAIAGAASADAAAPAPAPSGGGRDSSSNNNQQVLFSDGTVAVGVWEGVAGMPGGSGQERDGGHVAGAGGYGMRYVKVVAVRKLKYHVLIKV